MSTPAPPTPAQLISAKLDVFFVEQNGVVPPIIFKESLMHVIQGVECVRVSEVDDWLSMASEEEMLAYIETGYQHISKQASLTTRLSLMAHAWLGLPATP